MDDKNEITDQGLICAFDLDGKGGGRELNWLEIKETGQPDVGIGHLNAKIIGVRVKTLSKLLLWMGLLFGFGPRFTMHLDMAFADVGVMSK